MADVTDLDAVEARVLGCLIEKEATTPDAYPLTLNALRNACNQTTSRDPVMALDDHSIDAALTSLRGRGLTRTVHSTSNRATKFRHVASERLALSAPETALLSVLLLRGAQTVGELKGRSERQHRFESLDDVTDALARMVQREQPLVRQLERQPGQKDVRWVHLLCGERHVWCQAPDVTQVANDPYGEATAEFYDLLATDMWESFGLQLIDLLADVDPQAGPIVDVGSGTGVGLAYLVGAVPGAEVLAIEPSKAMRVALHTRLHDSPALRGATTVSPTTLAGAELPVRASAVVMSAVLGHLTDDERRRLWTFVAERMPIGAPAVVGVLPPARPLSVPLVKYHECRVGQFRYEGWQSGEPLDDRRMMWTLMYRVVDGRSEAVVAEYTASAPWRCDGVDDVRAEVAEFGLVVVEQDDCVVVSRPVGMP